MNKLGLVIAFLTLSGCTKPRDLFVRIYDVGKKIELDDLRSQLSKRYKVVTEAGRALPKMDEKCFTAYPTINSTIYACTINKLFIIAAEYSAKEGYRTIENFKKEFSEIDKEIFNSQMQVVKTFEKRYFPNDTATLTKRYIKHENLKSEFEKMIYKQ